MFFIYINTRTLTKKKKKRANKLKKKNHTERQCRQKNGPVKMFLLLGGRERGFGEDEKMSFFFFLRSKI